MSKSLSNRALGLQLSTKKGQLDMIGQCKVAIVAGLVQLQSMVGCDHGMFYEPCMYGIQPECRSVYGIYDGHKLLASARM